MKRKLLSKMLVLGIIIFILCSGIGHSATINSDNDTSNLFDKSFKKGYMDLEIVSINYDIVWFYSDPRAPPKYKKENEIVIRNNGPEEF